MNNKNLVLIGLILLVIILGLWGYYFYGRTSVANPNITPLSQDTVNQPISTQQAISFDDESSLLKYIELSNPSKEQSMKFFEALDRFATSSDTVTISQCKASPVAVKAKLGTDIKITNNDSVDYTLIRSSKQYILPAGQTITIKPDFGAGAHGYRCDGKGFEQQPVAGIIFAVE